MPTLQPPHWLMIGGAFLVLAGVIGLAVSQEVESGTAVRPGDVSKPKTGAADSEVEEAEL
jgi:hypothetical protein